LVTNFLITHHCFILPERKHDISRWHSVPEVMGSRPGPGKRLLGINLGQVVYTVPSQSSQLQETGL